MHFSIPDTQVFNNDNGASSYTVSVFNYNVTILLLFISLVNYSEVLMIIRSTISIKITRACILNCLVVIDFYNEILQFLVIKGRLISHDEQIIR